jgi:glycosyltransferase involved in cell wall biosynthesis
MGAKAPARHRSGREREMGAKAPASHRWLRRLVASVPEPSAEDFVPTVLVDIELSAPVPTLAGDGFAAAHVLVKLHGQPVGALNVSLANGPIAPAVLIARAEEELAEALEAHRRRDSPAGDKMPRCIRDLAPPDPAPLVSVVLATHDRAEQLETCLTSLLGGSYPVFEVVVVDNAPSDESAREMVEARFAHDPRVRYVREDRAGASLARNVGARAARGEYVAFTDDDTVVDPLWLNAIVAGFGDDPRVACVTGLTLPGGLESPAQQAFELYGGMALGYESRVYDLDENRGDTLLYPYTAGIFGASNNAAFRRSAFLDRGGFDVVLGPATHAFGAEDLDLFLALILDGHRIVYEPRAMLRHEHRRDYADLYWQVFTYSAGFTALLTKWAVTNRAAARELTRRVPRLLPAALFGSQRGGADTHGEYPSQLRWLERAGYVYGPVAYLRSRARSFADVHRGPARALVERLRRLRR